MARKKAVKEDILREIELRHQLFQRGMFFSGEQKTPNATLLFSEDIKDFNWNYAAQINSTAEKLPAVIREATNFYKNMNKLPCFYITPLSQPQNAGELLAKSGFVNKGTESWMVFGKKKIKVGLPGNFIIKKAETINDMMEFIDVFNQSFSVKGAHITLPKEYGESLFRSFTEQSAPATVIHYIGYSEEVPASVCTVIHDGKYAGIYNTGTLEYHRKKGFGAAVLTSAIDSLLKQKVKTIFLQTLSGSENEKFFSEIGFTSKFTADFFVLEEK